MESADWRNTAFDIGAFLPGQGLLAQSRQRSEISGYPWYRSDQAMALQAGCFMALQGEDVAVAYPDLTESGLVQCVAYLFAVREDVLAGSWQTSWANAARWSRRSDLVVFTTPLKHLAALSQIPAIECLHFNKRQVQGNEPLEARPRRALLINPDADMLNVMEALQRRAAPFAFLFDASPTGKRYELERTVEAVGAYFPHSPHWIAYERGDSFTDRSVKRLPLHQWVERPRESDPESLGTFDQCIEIWQLDDGCMYQWAQQAISTLSDIKPRVQHYAPHLLKTVIQPLQKVVYSLLSLPCAYPYLDQALTARRKSGRYPVHPLGDLLEKVKGTDMRSGELQRMTDELVDWLTDCLDVLQRPRAMTAKAQAIHALMAADESSSSAVLVVNDRYEAQAIENQRIASNSGNCQLTIIALGDSDKMAHLEGGIDHLIISARLWFDRLWILGKARRVSILAYTFECEALMRTVKSWVYYTHPPSDADTKAKWWGLAYAPGQYLKDNPSPDTKASPLSTLPTDYTGFYPELPRNAVIEHANPFEDWFDALFGDNPEPAIAVAQPGSDDKNGRDQWRIEVKEDSEALHLVSGQRVLVFQVPGSREEFIEKPVKSLEAGDAIVLIEHDEVWDHTYEALYELLYQHYSGVDAYERMAGLWNAYVEKALAACHNDPYVLHKQVKEHGVDVGIQTIGNWIKAKYLGPENPDAVPVMAKLAGVANPEDMGKRVAVAIKTLQTTRRTFGRELRKAILERASNAQSVTLADQTLDVEVLDQMIRYYTVEAITPCLRS